jgi:cytochrome c-type biogenesis protein CcsB
LYESLLFLCFLFIIFLLFFSTTIPSVPNAYIKYKNRFQDFRFAVLTLIPTVILGFAFFYLPSTLQRLNPLIPALQSNWLFIHVTVTLLSYIGLLAGSSVSLLFLFVDSWRTTNKLLFVDFLASREENSYRLILFSYPLLTVGILSGAIWANETWGSFWSWDPKETWSLVTWLIFTAYLHQHLLGDHKNKKPILLARRGFVSIWISYLGVNLIGKGLHRYGWFSLSVKF